MRADRVPPAGISAPSDLDTGRPTCFDSHSPAPWITRVTALIGCPGSPLTARSRSKLLCSVKSGFGVFQETPDASGDEPFDASSGLSFGLAFGGSAGDVGLGRRAASLPGDGDEVEGPVELAVAATVEAGRVWFWPEVASIGALPASRA